MNGGGGGDFGTAKKNMVHGLVNISSESLFGHLHSNLYLGEEFCVTTTNSEL